MSDKDRNSWWRDWFNAIYLDVYAHRDENDALLEVEAALSILPLEPKHRILDLCCGNGRHCRALRKNGYPYALGMDYSLPLLEYALAEDSHVKYIRGDMRQLPFRNESMDAVLSFFTSFGYFTDHDENLAVLRESSRILRPGGSILLDYLNPNYVRRTFIPETTRKHGEYWIRERRALSPEKDRIEKEIIIQNWGDHDHHYHESVRLYEYDQMLDMFQSAGIVVEGALGSFDGQPYHISSPRMILYGHRK